MSASSTTTVGAGPLYAALARFETTADFIAAIEKTAEAGYTKYDPHSPFPVHGTDDAMRAGRSILPGFVLCGGLTGTTFATLLAGWPSAVDYRIIIAGKEFFSIEAFVPILFELTILFAGFTTLFGMLILNRLPRLHHPIFNSETFSKRGSDDGFFIAIEASDPKFDPAGSVEFLKSIGGHDVELVYDDEEA